MSDENENPLDPIRYELKLVTVKRSETETDVGWTLAEKASGLLVERVAEKSAADAAALASGDYIMSVNGRRTKKNSDVDEAMAQSPVNIRLIVARRRAKPLDVSTMTLPTGVERRIDCDYLVFRFDQASFQRVGIRIEKVDGRMVVKWLDGSGLAAAYECGLRVDDQILTIGSARLRDEQHFRRILRVVQGDPVDFLVERRPRTEPDLPNPPQATISQSTSSEEGVPSTGVPDVPVDLETYLNKHRVNITKPISWKAEPDGKSSGTGPKKTRHSGKRDDTTGKRAKIKKPDASQSKNKKGS